MSTDRNILLPSRKEANVEAMDKSGEEKALSQMYGPCHPEEKRLGLSSPQSTTHGNHQTLPAGA